MGVLCIAIHLDLACCESGSVGWRRRSKGRCQVRAASPETVAVALAPTPARCHPRALSVSESHQIWRFEWSHEAHMWSQIYVLRLDRFLTDDLFLINNRPRDASHAIVQTFVRQPHDNNPDL